LALAAGTSTILADWTGGEPARLTAAQVVRASQEKDEFATLLWTDAIRFLGLALTNAVTLLNPARLVLGGGVVEMAPALVQHVASRVEGGTTVMAKRAVRVVTAELGEWAGAVGAASLVAEECYNRPS
jgi:glucokinase